MSETPRQTKSQLAWSTIQRYRNSPLLERDDSGNPIYLHRENCPSYCDYACNGRHGEHIAEDIAASHLNTQEGGEP